jgi:PhnB protein
VDTRVVTSFPSTITPVLTVRSAAAAIRFYEQALGAVEVYRESYPGGAITAELAIEEARFRVADEAPQANNFSPDSLNGTSVRLNLLVADPDALVERASACGAVVVAPVVDHDFGLRQGRIADPFGHHWLIGRPLPDSSGDWTRFSS